MTTLAWKGWTDHLNCIGTHTMTKRIAILGIFAIAIGLSCLSCAHISSGQRGNGEKELLTSFLEEASVNLRFYYTLESKAEEIGSIGKPILYYRLVSHDPHDPQPTSMDGLIRELRGKLPDCTVIRNRKNPGIIHIIETSLTKMPDYVMEQKVDITYSGVLGGVVSEIAKQLEGIGGRSSGVGGMEWDDWVTEVTVSAKDQRVRDVLTDAVPLENRTPMLWLAVMEVENGRPKAIVQFAPPIR